MPINDNVLGVSSLSEQKAAEGLGNPQQEDQENLRNHQARLSELERKISLHEPSIRTTDPVVSSVEQFSRQAAELSVVDYKKKACRLVYTYAKTQLENRGDYRVFFESDVFLVWFCKTLQNWKALVGTTCPDQLYYEVTYDGDKKVAYIDAYQKLDNVVVPDAL